MTQDDVPFTPQDQEDPAFAGIIHATAVVIGEAGVVIRGKSGTGKSDLALRLIDRGATLLSDDYVHVEAREGKIAATAPPNISGMMEVRGIGVVKMPHQSEARLAMIVELLDQTDPPPERYPLEQQTIRLCGLDLPVLPLCALESSAPVKVEMALKLIAGDMRRGATS